MACGNEVVVVKIIIGINHRNPPIAHASTVSHELVGSTKEMKIKSALVSEAAILDTFKLNLHSFKPNSTFTSTSFDVVLQPVCVAIEEFKTSSTSSSD